MEMIKLNRLLGKSTLEMKRTVPDKNTKSNS